MSDLVFGYEGDVIFGKESFQFLTSSFYELFLSIFEMFKFRACIRTLVLLARVRKRSLNKEFS